MLKKETAYEILLGGLTIEEFLGETLTNYNDQMDMFNVIEKIYASIGECSICAHISFGDNRGMYCDKGIMKITDIDNQYCDKFIDGVTPKW